MCLCASCRCACWANASPARIEGFISEILPSLETGQGRNGLGQLPAYPMHAGPAASFAAIQAMDPAAIAALNNHIAALSMGSGMQHGGMYAQHMQMMPFPTGPGVEIGESH